MPTADYDRWRNRIPQRCPDCSEPIEAISILERNQWRLHHTGNVACRFEGVFYDMSQDWRSNPIPISITPDEHLTVVYETANIPPFTNSLTLGRIRELYEDLLQPTPTEEMATRASGSSNNQAHLHRNGVHIVDGKIVSIMDDDDGELEEEDDT